MGVVRDLGWESDVVSGILRQLPILKFFQRRGQRRVYEVPAWTCVPRGVCTKMRACPAIQALILSLLTCKQSTPFNVACRKHYLRHARGELSSDSRLERPINVNNIVSNSVMMFGNHSYDVARCRFGADSAGGAI